MDTPSTLIREWIGLQNGGAEVCHKTTGSPVPMGGFLKGVADYTALIAIRPGGVHYNDDLQLFAIGPGFSPSFQFQPNTAVIYARDGLTGGLRIGAGGKLRLFANGYGAATVVTIDGGKVGINNETPADALDVVGSIRQSAVKSAILLGTDSNGKIIASTVDLTTKDELVSQSR